jgi:NAD(P)-dependent dehydrogenase (short-subunit alcohol dehydrogenase family)
MPRCSNTCILGPGGVWRRKIGRLEGQGAIIIGASSGIGRATALAFAAEGAKVALASRREDALQQVAATIAECGGEALVFPTDVSLRQDVDALVEIAARRFGHIDVLVNTAGVNTAERELSVLRKEDWDRIMDINLGGAFHCTQAVLPHMRCQKNGLIIHISSISGKWGDGSGAAYQASKHGIVGLAYATMFEERFNGIRVTLIFPGLCDTPLLDNRPSPLTPELRQQMMQPGDIAQACVFVASLPARTYVPELVLMPGVLQVVGEAAH